MSQKCCWATCVAVSVGRATMVVVVRAIVGQGVGTSVDRGVCAIVGGTDVAGTDVAGSDGAGTAAGVGVANSKVASTVGATAAGTCA